MDARSLSTIKNEKRKQISAMEIFNSQIAIVTFFRQCSENGLEINQDKSKIITYTLKKDPIMIDYTLNGKEIKR